MEKMPSRMQNESRHFNVHLMGLPKRQQRKNWERKYNAQKFLQAENIHYILDWNNQKLYCKAGCMSGTVECNVRQKIQGKARLLIIGKK